MASHLPGQPLAVLWQALRRGLDRLTVWLPIILMGLMALGTYWLARSTPTLPALGDAQRPLTHEPDYYMRRFAVKTFDASGRLKSEVFGAEARHYPDTDTLEIDHPRIRSFNARGELTVATATRALTNGKGTEVQLFGDAVVTRAGSTDGKGKARPALEFRGEFLHAFLDTEKLRSHKPVTLIHGGDRFSAASLEFDNLDRVLLLQGRVRGVLTPGASR